MIAKSGLESAFGLRHFLSRKIAPNSKTSTLGAPFAMPGYNEILRHLNYSGSENHQVGTPAAFVYGDPNHGLVSTTPKDSLHHPHYSGHVPGINFGTPKPIPLHELLPHAAQAYMDRHRTNDPTHSGVRSNLVTSAMKSGKRHIDFDTARRLANG
jgi:hypothetical protein